MGLGERSGARALFGHDRLEVLGTPASRDRGGGRSADINLAIRLLLEHNIGKNRFF